MLGDGEHINTRLPIIMKESTPSMHMLHRRKRPGITLRILSHKQRKIRNERKKGEKEGRGKGGKGKREKKRREKRRRALSTGRSPMPRNHPDPPKALVEWQRPAASAPLRGLYFLAASTSSRPLLPRGLACPALPEPRS